MLTTVQFASVRDINLHPSITQLIVISLGLSVYYSVEQHRAGIETKIHGPHDSLPANRLLLPTCILLFALAHSMLRPRSKVPLLAFLLSEYSFLPVYCFVHQYNAGLDQGPRTPYCLPDIESPPPTCILLWVLAHSRLRPLSKVPSPSLQFTVYCPVFCL